MAILLVFLLYCGAAQRNQSWYRVPEYRVVELNILGRATPTRWQSPAYASARHEQLSTLGKRRYQPVEPIGPPRLPRVVGCSQVLTRDDLEELVARGVHTVRVRDPAAILRFADRGFVVRQDISAPQGAGRGEERVVATAGEPVTKEVVDRCLEANVTRMPVVGAGDVVGFNATMLMVVLIFVGMTLVLTDVFWEPVMVLIDSRQVLVADGRKAVRANAREARDAQAERERRLRAMRDAYQERMRKARSRAMHEVDTILHRTRVHLKRMREEAASRLHASAARAEAQVRDELPALADSLVQRISGNRR